MLRVTEHPKVPASNFPRLMIGQPSGTIYLQPYRNAELYGVCGPNFGKHVTMSAENEHEFTPYHGTVTITAD